VARRYGVRMRGHVASDSVSGAAAPAPEANTSVPAAEASVAPDAAKSDPLLEWDGAAFLAPLDSGFAVALSRPVDGG
jgi:hypothetical protein